MQVSPPGGGFQWDRVLVPGPVRSPPEAWSWVSHSTVCRQSGQPRPWLNSHEDLLFFSGATAVAGVARPTAPLWAGRGLPPEPSCAG